MDAKRYVNVLENNSCYPIISFYEHHLWRMIRNPCCLKPLGDPLPGRICVPDFSEIDEKAPKRGFKLPLVTPLVDDQLACPL